MIHSFYEHGGDQPATGLSSPQITGASRDAAGTLWVDLEAPSAQERTAILVTALGAEPPGYTGAGPEAAQGLVLGARHARLVARVPAASGDRATGSAAGGAAGPGSSAARAAGTGALDTLVLYVGPNFVVTEHQGLPFLARLRESARESMPQGGALAMSGEVLAGASAWCAERLAALDGVLRQIENDVSESPGRETGRRLYSVRRELEVLSESLPTLAAACRSLAAVKSTGGAAGAAGSATPLEPAAASLERQARVARRLRRRGDLAMAAHSAELMFGLRTWMQVGVATAIVAALAVVAALLLIGSAG